MLKRPTRPLPRQFRRPLTPQTRTFVERRHRRGREHRYERWRRWARRWKALAIDGVLASRRWLKFVIAGVVVLIICIVLFSPILHIRDIRVIRTEGRVDIRKVLETLAPFYDRHLLFVSSRDVAARVREAVPDASDIIVSKHYPSELSVQITLVPFVARIVVEPPLRAGSGSLAPASASGSAFRDYLTQNGMLVSTDHPDASQPLPTIRIDDWTVRPVAPLPLLTPDFLDRMRRAEQALTVEFGQQIKGRVVYLRAREFHLETPALSFWFDMRSTLEEQLERLRVFLQAVKLTQVKNYVDLRLTGRVVYK